MEAGTAIGQKLTFVTTTKFTFRGHCENLMSRETRMAAPCKLQAWFGVTSIPSLLKALFPDDRKGLEKWGTRNLDGPLQWVI